MGLKFTNFSRTTLLVGINAVDTSMTVAAGTGALFPTLGGGDYFYAVLVTAATNTKEIVKVTARTGDVMTMTRAQEGTTGTIFSAGDIVELRLTAAGLAEFVAASSALLLSDLGVTVQGYDANTLKSNATKALTAGYTATPYNAGTKSSGTFTPDPANGNQQYCVNGGAFTLAPPANATSIILEVLNNASAGAITTSGFTKVVGSFTTTNAEKFACNILKTQNYSLLQIQALQ